MALEIEQKVKDFITSGKPLVIGLGNTYMGDDCAGVAIVQKLEANGIKTLNAGRSLLEAFYRVDAKEFDRLLIVDAAELGLSPGTILTVEEQEIVARGLSTHENNLALALSFYRSQNPGAQVLYLALQYGFMDMTDDMTLTPEMGKGVEEVVNMLSKLLKK